MLYKSLGFAAAAGYAALKGRDQETKCWIYRDDIGAFWGIHGYEEQVTEVGTHHGNIKHLLPQYRFFGAWDAGSVRRGWQVFSRNCANCHGMIYEKYDKLLDKGYKQLELQSQVSMFSINPAHLHFKGNYFQEWDDRDRVITDYIYPTYYSQDQAKKANGGVWPTDFSKIVRRPGSMVYIYNILTGYHFKPPFGIDVPKGKYFNPYFDHMIIGMPRQLHDGMLDYDDGTPASTPQMAYDVSNFLTFMQRRVGFRYPDFSFFLWTCAIAVTAMIPLRNIVTQGFLRNVFSYRIEQYAVRDGLYYKHFRTGQRSIKANLFVGRAFA